MFAVIAVFALIGGALLKVLGISVGSFQVGGGILVLLIAISMMNGNDNPAKQNLGAQPETGKRAPPAMQGRLPSCPSPYRSPSVRAVFRL